MSKKNKKPMAPATKKMIEKLAFAGYVILVVTVIGLFTYFFMGTATATRQYHIDQYHEEVELYNNSQYGSALEKFWDLTKFRDSLFDGPPLRNT